MHYATIMVFFILKYSILPKKIIWYYNVGLTWDNLFQPHFEQKVRASHNKLP